MTTPKKHAPAKQVEHRGRVTDATPMPSQAEQALAIVRQAAEMAPLPKQAHLQVEQALLVLAQLVGGESALDTGVEAT